VIRSVSADWPGEYKAKVWAEVLEPEGAQTLFQYQQDYYASRAAVTVSDYGRGKVIYVGTLLEPRFYSELARRACEWAKVGLGPEIPPGVDFAVRQGKQHTFSFVLNFSPSPKFITLPGKYRDLLSGKMFDRQVEVPSLELRVLVEE
jgi:beta-galactosidase